MHLRAILSFDKTQKEILWYKLDYFVHVFAQDSILTSPKISKHAKQKYLSDYLLLH